MYPWELRLGNLNPNRQVDVLNETILNIMSNFISNEVKTVNPREPEWMNTNIKTLSRRKNKVFKRYKKNGYKNEDKVVVDRLRNECQEAIVNAKENYFKNLGSKLADPTTGQKSYWKILNTFLDKCKNPKIPCLLVDDKYITNCKEKASIFSDFFSSQCTPFANDSILPAIRFHTVTRISTFQISLAEIN